MLISFIVPHYNLDPALLRRCISSIIEQEVPRTDYEILIIDDGSIEPPTWVVGEYSQTNIQLITAKHRGPGAARNTGIDKAAGEYIQFIDADDCLVSHALKGHIEILKQERPDILQHGYRVCPSEEDIKKGCPATRKTKKYDTAAEFAANNNLSGSPCNYIFRKGLADRYGIRFATNVMHEDEDFNLKLYYYGGQLICSNATLYNYCIRNGSITASEDYLHEHQRIKDLFLLLERVVAFRFGEQEKSSAIQRKALNRKITMLTVDTLLNLYYNGNSASEIEEVCHKIIEPLGLYPLPDKNYSLKYTAFRILSNSRNGRKILRKILPSEKPQKR